MVMVWGCKFDSSPDIWKGFVVDAQQEPSSPRLIWCIWREIGIHTLLREKRVHR